MKQYNELMQDILDNGTPSDDRTGVGTLSVFGRQIRFDLNEGFPAATTKKLAWKAVVGELLWFMEGGTDERRLAELTYGKDRSELIGKNTIWTANADKQGVDLGYENHDTFKELGPVYGHQWRSWGNVDQLAELVSNLKRDPNSRRHILTAWNVADLEDMSLPPCHVLSQFYVRDGKLSCLLFQRSLDAFLGGPFNIASYALLTHLLAREVGIGVGDFVYTIGDAHIYKNHVEQVKEQLTRAPLPLPTLRIDPSFSLVDFLRGGALPSDASLFTLDNYQSHDTIKAPMAV